MSEFYIRCSRITTQAEELQEYARTMQQLAQRIESIRKNLKIETSGKVVIQESLTKIEEEIKKQAKMMKKMGTTLQSIMTCYLEAENKLTGKAVTTKSTYRGKNKESVPPVQEFDARMIFDEILKLIERLNGKVGQERINDGQMVSEVFDENGQYGGNQADPMNETDANKKQEYYDILRKYRKNSDGEELTNEECEALLKRFETEGCGYVAIANTLLDRYLGREEEFKKIFGIPMYDGDGRLNFNKLTLDIYASTDNHNEYDGKDMFDEFEDWDLAKDQVDNMSLDETGVGSDEAQQLYRTNLYMKNHGVKVETKNVLTMNKKDYERLIEDGSYIVLNNKYGELHRVKPKNIKGDPDNKKIEEGHAMLVTGITSDGKIMVSSWGEQYYYKPSESPDYNGKMNFEIITYK